MLRSETDRKTRDERLGQLVKYCMISGALDLNLYQEYDVKRGLRESDGKGVLTGLTEISDVVAFKTVHGEKVPCPGELYFQGYNVMDLKNGFATRKFNYEEITYLLLFGALPNKTQLQEFIEILSQYRELPNKFVRDVIMKAPSMDIMNALQRSVLTLYSYDDNADDISIPNVLRQALSLIATMPLISVYAYHAYQHYHNDQSLVIRYPDPELSTAENILRILRHAIWSRRCGKSANTGAECSATEDAENTRRRLESRRCGSRRTPVQNAQPRRVQKARRQPGARLQRRMPAGYRRTPHVTSRNGCRAAGRSHGTGSFQENERRITPVQYLLLGLIAILIVALVALGLFWMKGRSGKTCARRRNVQVAQTETVKTTAGRQRWRQRNHNSG